MNETFVGAICKVCQNKWAFLTQKYITTETERSDVACSKLQVVKTGAKNARGLRKEKAPPRSPGYARLNFPWCFFFATSLLSESLAQTSSDLL